MRHRVGLPREWPLPGLQTSLTGLNAVDRSIPLRAAVLTARLLESWRIFACVAWSIPLGGWRRLHTARLLAKRQLEAAPRILHLLVLGPSLLCIQVLLVALVKICRRGRRGGASLRPAVAADDQLSRPCVAALVHKVLHCDVPLLI